MMKLYHRMDCPFCWKVRIFLAEAGIAVDEIIVEFGKKHPDVMALNPNGTVPVLVTEDFVLWESAVIIEYLADKYKDAGLLSGTAEQRAKIRQLHSYSDALVGKILFPHIKRVREGEGDKKEIRPDPETEEGWQNIQKLLSNALANDPFFGPEFSVADCALIPRITLAHIYGLPLGDDFQSLKNWFRSCVKRPSFKRCLPEHFLGIDEMIKPEKFLI